MLGRKILLTDYQGKRGTVVKLQIAVREDVRSRPSGANFKIFQLCQKFLPLPGFDPWPSIKHGQRKISSNWEQSPPARIYITGGVTNPDEFYFSLKTAFPEYIPQDVISRSLYGQCMILDPDPDSRYGPGTAK